MCRVRNRSSQVTAIERFRERRRLKEKRLMLPSHHLTALRENNLLFTREEVASKGERKRKNHFTIFPLLLPWLRRGRWDSHMASCLWAKLKTARRRLRECLSDKARERDGARAHICCQNTQLRLKPETIQQSDVALSLTNNLSLISDKQRSEWEWKINFYSIIAKHYWKLLLKP